LKQTQRDDRAIVGRERFSPDCSRKLTSVIVSLFLAAVLSLSGCAVARDPAPIDGNYGVVERVIEGDTLLMETVSVSASLASTRPKPSTLANPLSTSGKHAAAFTRRMSRANVYGFSSTSHRGREIDTGGH
jgi:hypothetical protein